MRKTIKTSKHMRLDELVSYCRENEIKDKSFYSATETSFGIVNKDLVKIHKKIRIDVHGRLQTYDWIDPDDLFVVEYEEKFNNDTKFDHLLEVLKNKEYKDPITFGHAKCSINDVLNCNSSQTETRKIYTLIGEDLEIIWEANDDA